MRDNETEVPGTPVSLCTLHMKKRLENFWYYHKIHTLILLAVLAAGIYLFLTHRSSVKSDYDIAIVSPNAFTEEQTAAIKSIIEQLGTDQNGDNTVTVNIHIYRFSIGEAGQDQQAVAGLDADLVGKMSGIFFVDSPDKFEAATNELGKAADAIPVSNIPALTGCGIDDLWLLIRTEADPKYSTICSALIR